MVSKRSQHGGKRKNQTGRPPIPEAEKQICKTIRLRQEEWESLAEIGGGENSAKDGIRVLLEEKISKKTHLSNGQKS